MPSLSTVAHKVGAAIVLLLIAVIILRFALGFLTVIAFAIIAAVLVAAFLWALNQLL